MCSSGLQLLSHGMQVVVGGGCGHYSGRFVDECDVDKREDERICCRDNQELKRTLKVYGKKNKQMKH